MALGAPWAPSVGWPLSLGHQEAGRGPSPRCWPENSSLGPLRGASSPVQTLWTCTNTVERRCAPGQVGVATALPLPASPRPAHLGPENVPVPGPALVFPGSGECPRQRASTTGPGSRDLSRPGWLAETVPCPGPLLPGAVPRGWGALLRGGRQKPQMLIAPPRGSFPSEVPGCGQRHGRGRSLQDTDA
ncbi:hypothetical protein HJG60_009620 [Phyllostomus discolor]|uniref:Uncharacterized protein n=1 Tax=Phyllostomus discolor TaxID=89673 RepID=A0A833YFG2_9CHIR|nr:hypothetical protein HJG60_009620 [Phyllostomus discolor]